MSGRLCLVVVVGGTQTQTAAGHAMQNTGSHTPPTLHIWCLVKVHLLRERRVLHGAKGKSCAM